MNAYASASRGYRESSVLTASPGRLVVMLYDGAHRFLVQAAAALRAGDMPRAGDRMGRAEAIVDQLLSTLDMSAGEVAERLEALYVFSKRTLLEARLEKSPEKVEQVDAILTDLREAWAEIAGS